MNKIIFFCALLVFLFATETVFCQKSKADSLENKLQSISGKEKINVLNDLADMYNYIDTRRSIEFSTQAVSLSKKLNYRSGLAEAYANYGFSYINLDNEKAISNTKEALKIRREINDKSGIASSLNVLGIIYYYRSEYLVSIDYHLQALKMREEFGDKSKIATSYNNIALVYIALKNFDTALEYLNKALVVRIATNNKPGIGIIKDNIGAIYRLMGKYEEALEQFEESLTIAREIGYKKNEANALYNIGRINLAKKNYPDAISCLNDALKLYTEHEDKNGIANVETSLAATFNEMKDYNAAVRHAENALKKAAIINSLDNMAISSDILRSVYERKGDYKSAYKYLTMQKSIQDSLKSDAKLKRINKLELDYKIEKMKKAQEIELNKQKFFSFSLGVTALFILVVAMLMLWEYRNKKKRNEQLFELNTKLQQLNSTKDKFFSIIAHDLKNPFNAIINSSKLMRNDYDSFQKKDHLQFLNIIIKSSDAAYNLLENLLLWARSQRGKIHLEKKFFNLADAVNESIELFSNQISTKNITIKLKVNLKGNVYSDYFTTGTVIRNLLGNAIKYTPEGGIVEIEDKETNDEIQLDFKDGGVGISEEDMKKLFRIDVSISRDGTAGEKGTGLGLIICKDFIEANGGRIWAVSKLKEGSTFSFTLPKGKT